ncbi:hypothetical protein D3C71_2160470 [compost metagenome]
MVSRLEGLLLTKDGVYVMEQLVGAGDHDHLVRLALFSFFLVVLPNPRIGSPSNSTLYGQI